MSNTGQSSAEPVGGWMFETPECVVDVARVHASVLGRDAVSFAPEGFAMDQPGALVDRRLLAVPLST